MHKRLREKKYITYRRIDIQIFDDGDKMGDFAWEDKKTACINCYFELVIVKDVSSPEAIAALYANIFDALELLWNNNGWNVNDLIEIHDAIKVDNYFSSMVYGKSYISPDARIKAEFVCELYPGYTDYYFRYFDRGELVQREIKFLRGHQDPAIFLDWLPNRGWRDNVHFLMSDANKEIFYIFNIKDLTCSVEFRPVYRSLEECENFVVAFQAGISHQETMRLLGLPYN